MILATVGVALSAVIVALLSRGFACLIGIDLTINVCPAVRSAVVGVSSRNGKNRTLSFSWRP